MFWNKRNRSRRANANATINWIIVLMVGVAFINHYNSQGKLGDLPETVKGNASKTMMDLKQYRNKILPPEPTTLTMQDVELGSGSPAVCGQTVSLAYKTFTEAGEPVEDGATPDAPLTFTIGEKKAMPAFEEGVVGMRKEGVRKFFAPPAYAYGAEGFGRKNVPLNDNITFEATLLDITPPLPDPAQTAFRFLEARSGHGPAATCGKAAPVHITVWSVDGGKLFTTRGEGKQPIMVTPGSSTYFLGLEHTLLGMKPGGTRTAIVPPDFQKNLHDTPEPLNIPFPEGQTVLVDIEYVQ